MLNLIAKINDAFAGVEPPEHFTNHEHCAECLEHDQTLKTHTPDSIGRAQLGNQGWDPICFVNSDQGYQYYLPGLARLALGQGDDYYLDQFLFHLNTDRIRGLGRDERELVARFLEECIAVMGEEIDANLDSDVVLLRISELRAEIA